MLWVSTLLLLQQLALSERRGAGLDGRILGPTRALGAVLGDSEPSACLHSFARRPSAAERSLTRSPAGDYGFDPLRLGGNSSSLPWFVEAERQNGRWAMLAVAGILTNDLLGLSESWWVPDASAHLSGGAPTARVAIEVAVMATAEALRIAAFTKDGPGAKAFDPAGLNSAEKQLKEIKNGRLAMIAFLGFTSQAAVRGLGPIACLQAHLADPGHVNIFTSSVGSEAAVAVVALAIAPMFLQAQKTLKSDSDKEEFRPIPW